MYRRTYLVGSTIGLTSIAGCLNFTATSNNGGPSGSDTGADAPQFRADEDAPGTFILLRQQPQNPNGIVVGDEFETAIVLGNAGGEPVSGEVSVELIPPNDNEAIQTATVIIDVANELPSGAAGFFTIGLFEATVAGDWELTAGPEIEQIHPEYIGTIKVKDQSDG